MAFMSRHACSMVTNPASAVLSDEKKLFKRAMEQKARYTQKATLQLPLEAVEIMCFKGTRWGCKLARFPCRRITYGDNKNRSEWYGLRVNKPFPKCTRPWAIRTCKRDKGTQSFSTPSNTVQKSKPNSLETLHRKEGWHLCSNSLKDCEACRLFEHCWYPHLSNLRKLQQPVASKYIF